MVVAVTRPRAQGYGVRLGSDYFRVAPSPAEPLVTYTQDSLAPRQDDRGSAGDNVLALGYSFGRQNLTGGEGLDWWPRIIGETPSELDLIRFWDSENIDIRRPQAGEPYLTTLTKQWANFWTPTASPVDMGASRDAIYIVEGANVHRFDDWVDNTPEDTDTPGGTIIMLEVGLDDTVVVVDNAGDVYMKPDNSDTYVKVYDSSVDGGDVQAAWWVKGRVLAARRDPANATRGDLLEVAPGIGGTTAAPTSTNTVTVIDTYEGEVNDVIDAGHAIVVGFSDGSLRSYVPQTDTAGGTPVLTVRARSNAPKNENPIALAWNLGQILVFTLDEAPTGASKVFRFYTATVLDERFDFAVGELRLIRAWRGVVETAPNYTKRIAVSRDEAFFMVGEGANEWNVWRFDFVTQGVFRHTATNRASAAGMTLFDGRLAVCDGADVVLESDTIFMPTGYLITPNITFGLNTPISWTSYVLEVLNLQTPGVKVELYASTDPEAIQDPNHNTWRLIETYTDPALSGLERSIVNIEGNQLALQVKWFRSNAGTTAPNVKRFAVRGLPQHRDWVIEVPINISDTISAPGRMPVRVPGMGDQVHSTLVGLQGKSTTCQLLDPPVTLRGIVERLAEPVTYMTHRGSQGRYCTVRFLGNLITTDPLAEVQGNAGIGVGGMGVTTMGVGEP